MARLVAFRFGRWHTRAVLDTFISRSTRHVRQQHSDLKRRHFLSTAAAGRPRRRRYMARTPVWSMRLSRCALGAAPAWWFRSIGADSLDNPRRPAQPRTVQWPALELAHRAIVPYRGQDLGPTATSVPISAQTLSRKLDVEAGKSRRMPFSPSSPFSGCAGRELGGGGGVGGRGVSRRTGSRQRDGQMSVRSRCQGRWLPDFQISAGIARKARAFVAVDDIPFASITSEKHNMPAVSRSPCRSVALNHQFRARQEKRAADDPLALAWAEEQRSPAARLTWQKECEAGMPAAEPFSRPVRGLKAVALAENKSDRPRPVRRREPRRRQLERGAPTSSTGFGPRAAMSTQIIRRQVPRSSACRGPKRAVDVALNTFLGRHSTSVKFTQAIAWGNAV